MQPSIATAAAVLHALPCVWWRPQTRLPLSFYCILLTPCPVPCTSITPFSPSSPMRATRAAAPATPSMEPHTCRQGGRRGSGHDGMSAVMGRRAQLLCVDHRLADQQVLSAAMPQGGLAPTRSAHAMIHSRPQITSHNGPPCSAQGTARAVPASLPSRSAPRPPRPGLKGQRKAMGWEQQEAHATPHPPQWEPLPAQQYEWRFATEHAVERCKVEPSACP